MSPPLEHGFSLIEAIVASLLIAISVAGLAQLVTVGVRQAATSQQSAQALTMAQAKLEELRTRTWRFTAAGVRVSSGELSLSPSSSLTEDAEGYFALLDRFGAPTADAPHYRLRWAVSAFEPGDPDTLLLQVCAFTPGRGAAPAGADACVSTIRTRKP